MDTIRKGNGAEAAVLAHLVKADVPVLIPFGGGFSFDLGAVVPPDDLVVRIQVKCGRTREGCVRFNSCSTDHGTGRQNYRRRADVIAVYVEESDSVFMVSVDDSPSFLGLLRLEPPRNNQRQGIRFAHDHTLEAWLERIALDSKNLDEHRHHRRHPHAEGEPTAA